MNASFREPIFHHWHLVENGRRTQPLSVGMVSAKGSFYAVFENAETVRDGFANPFVREKVLPHLPIHCDDFSNRESSWAWDLEHAEAGFLMSRPEIAKGVEEFLRLHENPDLISWLGGYDHMCFAQLFGRMTELPPDFPKHTDDIETFRKLLGYPRVVVERWGTQYHALDDARYYREVWNYLMRYAECLGLKLGKLPFIDRYSCPEEQA